MSDQIRPVAGPVAPTAAATCRLRPVPLGAASITGGLWWSRQEANRQVAIPSGRDQLESAGNLDNLRIAAGKQTGQPRGPVFLDSDLYKWLEAAAWEYGRHPTEGLLAAQLEVTALVAAAQEPDGYLNSFLQPPPRKSRLPRLPRLSRKPGKPGGPGKRYRHLAHSHEIYCAGHLIQAAVAQVRCTGNRDLLTVATRFADHLADTFGPDGRRELEGHPVIEMALVELFRETGERRYLELARYFVEARGHGALHTPGFEPAYFSDRVPVREQTTVEGHAVRAVYFGAGATDLAMETGDQELLQALERQFADMVATKSYVTGGLGSRWDLEAFGDPYELPPDRAYAETCAAIGGVQWAWRMLLATGDPSYADTAERILYNGFLAGESIGGAEYFYVNPLQLRPRAHPDHDRSPAHGRRRWFECACCPPNVMRTLASLGSYLATTDDSGLQLQLYAPSRLGLALPGGTVTVVVDTDYPWDGRVEVRIEETPTAEWTLSLRVPAWAQGATLSVNGTGEAVAAGTPATIRRQWAAGDVVELVLPLAVRLTGADERVDAVRGCVAVERGPLVYAVEQVDQPAGVSVDEIHLDPSRSPATDDRPDLLGGVVVVRLPGTTVHRERRRWPYRVGNAPATPAGADQVFTAVPYFAWANRGIGPMRVWLPRL